MLIMQARTGSYVSDFEGARRTLAILLPAPDIGVQPRNPMPL
jgi:hypothetical protein